MTPVSRNHITHMILQRFPCGCTIEELADGSHGINYCPKHKAAPDMYEALKEAKEWIAELQNSIKGLCEDEGLEYHEPTEPCKTEIRINKALAKAEGKE